MLFCCTSICCNILVQILSENKCRLKPGTYFKQENLWSCVCSQKDSGRTEPKNTTPISATEFCFRSNRV